MTSKILVSKHHPNKRNQGFGGKLISNLRSGCYECQKVRKYIFLKGEAMLKVQRHLPEGAQLFTEK